MTDVLYRPAEPTDIGAASELFIDTLADMLRRHGQSPAPYTAAAIAPVYGHILRTGIFAVAEVEGRLGAICHATVRDHLWFLSGFWTRPELQRRGIGGPLLTRVLDEGRRRGAAVSFTWSSIDFTAMATYLKRGLLPGYQVLTFAGKPSHGEPFHDGAASGPKPRAPAEPTADSRYETADLEASTAGGIDREVRATAREVDHVFWLGGSGRGREVRIEGRPAGYYYATNGAIGPAAWLAPEHGDAVLRLALRDAAAQAGEVRMVALGMNHTAIRFALQAGLRLVSTAHLLCTEPFGQMDRYVPSGPSLF